MSRYKIRIEPDPDPMSPREWDNLGIIAFWHRRYNYDERKGHETEGLDPKSFQEWLDAHPEVQYRKLFMLDHSGLRFSTSDFGDRWDSGQVGFIYSTPERIKWLGAPLDSVLRQLDNEVAELDAYVSGAYCGCIIEDENGNQLESCWGFSDEKCAREEAESIVRDLEAKDQYAHEKAMEAWE
jgi:hypothetical protein